jgi:hypothetical protein
MTDFQCQAIVTTDYLTGRQVKPHRCRATVREKVGRKMLCGAHARWARLNLLLEKHPPPPPPEPPKCIVCKGTKMLTDDDDEPVIPCPCTPDGRIYANQGKLLRKVVRDRKGNVVERREHPWQKAFAKCASIPPSPVAPGQSTRRQRDTSPSPRRRADAKEAS